MCDRCVTRAESALLYREQCRAADRALRQAALKVKEFYAFALSSSEHQLTVIIISILQVSLNNVTVI